VQITSFRVEQVPDNLLVNFHKRDVDFDLPVRKILREKDLQVAGILE
jgi:hypothetical protein